MPKIEAMADVLRETLWILYRLGECDAAERCIPSLARLGRDLWTAAEALEH